MNARALLLAAVACTCVLAVAPAFSKPPAPSVPVNSQTPPHATLQAGMQPGEYHTTVTFTDVTGLPPAVARRMMSRGQNHDGCMPTSDINAVVQDTIAASADMTCSEDHASAAGGVISGAATCHDNDGNSGSLTISGTYTATHADVSGTLHAQTQIGPVSENFRVVSDRTGACAS